MAKVKKGIVKKDQQRKKLKGFLEEFSWLLDSYSDVDFKGISRLLEDDQKKDLFKNEIFDSFTTENPNIHFMVGALPSIFSNEKLFKTNEDIVEFSQRILQLEIPRWTKISKNEIIGHIVCNANKLNDKKFSKLVRALGKIVSGDQGAKKIIKQAKSKNLDWNVIIQQLTADDL